MTPSTAISSRQAAYRRAPSTRCDDSCSRRRDRTTLDCDGAGRPTSPCKSADEERAFRTTAGGGDVLRDVAEHFVGGRDLAEKSDRELQGQIEEGKSGGDQCYG
jgi:hypothetical protein